MELHARYEPGALRQTATGETILDLPAGGYNNHWTRNGIARPDGGKLYVSVGSATKAMTLHYMRTRPAACAAGP